LLQLIFCRDALRAHRGGCFAQLPPFSVASLENVMPLRYQSRLSRLTLAAALAVLLSGCGKDEIGTVYPVSGRVLRNQEPIRVQSGYVVLKPDTANGNETTFEPSGTIDADGNYVIYTRRRKGAPPGWYKVVITATGETPKPTKGRSTSRPVPKPVLPAKYGQAKTTPLSIEVVGNPSEGAYDLDVTK
jgi:hypothetical protein